MEIILYKTSTPVNYLIKSLYSKKEITGFLKEGCSVMYPEIKLQFSELPLYNYCYIGEFKRYYFITEIVSLTHNIFSVKMKCDVLMSYKTQILNHSCIISKTQSTKLSNVYFDDGDFITENRKTVSIKKFPNSLNEDGTHILIVAGGV